MPQVVDLPPIGQDAHGALVALVRVCKDTPPKGEPFREFRSRLRAAKLWDRNHPHVMLRFLGVGGATVMPSAFMTTLSACTGEDDTAITFAVLDLPAGAIRRHLIAGRPAPRSLDSPILAAARAALDVAEP